jgi:type IX secretion system PorP/SprF family membrane protein
MKKWLSIALIIIAALQAKGQQDPMYGMFFFNRLPINPAYAGSRDQLSGVVLGRRQWVGFDNAPGTESFSLHAPTPDRLHGFGLSFVNDRNAFTNNARFTANYAYRIPMGGGHLALGLQTGLNSYWLKQSQVQVWDPGDPSFGNGGDFGKWMFVAGPGLYFSNENFYLGASVPDIMPHKLYDPYYEALVAKSVWHHYFMGGMILKLGQDLQFKPSFLLKATRGAPASLDLNASFLLKELIWVGASWRPKNAVSLMVEFYLSKSLRIGYAYDIPLNIMRNFSSGSHELMLGFDFGFTKSRLVSPKLF